MSTVSEWSETRREATTFKALIPKEATKEVIIDWMIENNSIFLKVDVEFGPNV